MAAKVLTEAGANVLMLEAGIMWDARQDAKMMAWPYPSPRRGAAIPERQSDEFDAGLGGWTLEGEPYTSAPGDRFDWFRTRMLGGGRSGSATDAGVPEFMDFMMIDQPARQIAMRGGLAWLDAECQEGIDGLQYLGHRSVARWNRCPEEALKKLGVSYGRA